MASLYGKYIFNLINNVKVFSKVAVPFAFLPVMSESSTCLRSLPTFNSQFFHNISTSNRYIEVSHWF